MRKKLSLAVLSIPVTLVTFVACGEGDPESLGDAEEAVESASQELFDCTAPDQRLTCDAPANPNKRFVCHPIGWGHHWKYFKIKVPVSSHWHVPGESDFWWKLADQAPGASSDDMGFGPGLDCDCDWRECDGVCTGADDGTACDDGDPCTGSGSCNGDVCDPGEPDGSCGEPAQVVLNEVESSGGDPGDWVELYNAGGSVADLSGWVFKDADDTHVYTLPAGTTIAAGAFLVLDEAAFDFGLGGGDSARLFDAQGTLVDSYTWAAHAASTYGRCPDGTGAFGNTNSSKGAPNDCTVSVAVTINEIESSGGVPGDWVELYNAGSSAADVSGWVFKDDDDTHVYTLPAGTTIAAGGYLVLEEAEIDFGLGGSDSARLFDAQGSLVDSHAWTAHAATTYGRCPDGTGPVGDMSSITKGAANDCAGPIRINEVESSGGVPGDWVEIYNTTPTAVDLSGWVFKDGDDTHVYTLPLGTSIAAGGYLVLDEATFDFGLGGADSARLFDAQGALVDSYSWTAHAATTYGRCPNGTGAFDTTAITTKGADNDCTGGSSSADPWPGLDLVTPVDAGNVFGENLSGIFYEAAGSDVLWAVRNDPSTLYRLVWNGSIWTPEAGAWNTGKTLRYTDGLGTPDAEDLTKAELSSSAVYAVTERDNDASGVSRLSILRFDADDAGSELVATHEWNITADLPAVGSNVGLEGITWIPDSFLVANAFFDASAGHLYNPAEYPDHGSGLFFVGVEATGLIHAYALNHQTGAFTRVATVASGYLTVKALSFDREVGYLWTACGSSCGNEMAVLVLDTEAASPTFGTFQVIQTFARPTTMPNVVNEGIAIAPESQCVSGQKSFIWSDDGQTSGYALREDTIPCGAFIP